MAQIPSLAQTPFASCSFSLYLQDHEIDARLRERVVSWFVTYEAPLRARCSNRDLVTLEAAYGSGFAIDLFIERENFDNCDLPVSATVEQIADVLNLLEGRGRPTLKDQKRIFHIAMGSLRECQAILLLAQLEHTKAAHLLDSLGAHLYRLIQNAK